jgi:hypothetical protein
MIEIKGDLFAEPCDAMCITTNGFVKANGECVMGRGCAKQAATYWPDLPKLLGGAIQKYGNVVILLKHLQMGTTIGSNPPLPVPKVLLSFPVKPSSAVYNGHNCVKHMRNKFQYADDLPGWAVKADLYIILESAKQLKNAADIYGWQKVVLPRPGCGAGELGWWEVKSILEQRLDDRFHVITW